MPILKFPRGADGAGIQLDGIVDTHADLPALGPGDAGATYLVDADGLLYVWSGTAWPADGNGVEFRGPIGPQGPQGEQGPAGAGVPAGGAVGQILVKSSGDDFDTEWADPAE